MGYTICDTIYTHKNHEYFNMFNFEPDHFQKYAIEALYEGKHVLVTAHTGSGKTVPAEFAISHFVSLGKKVVYTSPIKSLSNQKYHELSKQFPDISFGILTGDIKFNPEADCIIMTTEILQNIIFYDNQDNSPLDFQLNLEEFQCVIFDEVHYINDDARGYVWEECIMNLPQHIQMLMLSATINKPDRFVSWISTIKEKDIIITGTDKRVVPLTHYSCLNIPDSTYRQICKAIPNIEAINNSLVSIKSKDKACDEYSIHRVNKINQNLKKQNIYIKPSHVLNTIVDKLNKEQKLPAICFVFSRKKAGEYAKMIRSNLHDTQHVEDDTKKSSVIKKECESILRKLDNHLEYSNTPEYIETLSLLEKGIAVHHSGILPILREMIELLFSKGYIKLLFATETFAVGINMPTKTVMFTSLTKFDGTQERYLYPHEYTQMAGRAGRRGLDTIGYVIHLHSLFAPPTNSEYAHILSGNPPTITSKLHTNMRMILRMMEHCYHIESIAFHTSLPYFEKSLAHRDITLQLKQIEKEIKSIESIIYDMKETNKLFTLHNVFELMTKHKALSQKQQHTKKSKQKQIAVELQQIEYQLRLHGNIQNFITAYNDYININAKLQTKSNEYKQTKEYIQKECLQFYFILKSHNFCKDGKLTHKGLFASCIMESNSIVIAELYANKIFHNLSVLEIVQLLSCFTDIRVSEQYKIYQYDGPNTMLKNTLHTLEQTFNTYYDIECKEIGYLNEEDYYYHYDLIDCMEQWCNAESQDTTKYILNDIKQYNIFSGEFVKALLKIQALALELEHASKRLQDNILVEKFHQIPTYISKSIVTSQSLYI
jgi:superfamily II RNA helicase